MPQENGLEVVNVIGHMKKKGSLKVVIIGFILGISLLIAGSFVFGEKNDSEGDSATALDNAVSIEEYKKELTEEIEKLCLSTEGVKSAHAVIFFDNVGGSVYAQNIQSGTSDKSEYVIIGSGSNARPLYLGESLPKLSGIGVVCDMGGNDTLKGQLELLLSSVYGLPLTRVYVNEG